jgi:hypothetical protein
VSDNGQTNKLSETYIEKRAKDDPPPPMQSLLGVMPPIEGRSQPAVPQEAPPAPTKSTD